MGPSFDHNANLAACQELTERPVGAPLAVTGRATRLQAPASRPNDVYERRRKRIEEIEQEERKNLEGPGPHPPSKAPQMWFFYHMDVSTIPDLMKGADSRRMQSLINLLRVRLKDRGRAKVRGRRFVECKPKSAETHATALSASHLLAALITKAFGDINVPANLEKLDACFESFVCGDLALGGADNELQGHGEPNGINYLLFAQFALYLSEHDPDEQRRTIWTQALATFVRTSEIFLDLYWSGACRTFASYGFAWRDGREFSAGKRLRLQKAYEQVSRAGRAALSERFNLICAFALRDDIGCEVHDQKE